MTLQSHLTAANLSRAPGDSLQQADVALALLRARLHLCYDLGQHTPGQYKRAGRMLAEIGRLLGGWQQRTL